MAADSDPLHSVGMAILNFDPRFIGLGVIALMGIVYIVGALAALKSGKKSPWSLPDGKLWSALLAPVAIYGALKIGAVFLLTRPAAFESLADLDIVLVGLTAFPILFGLGITGLKGLFERAD